MCFRPKSIPASTVRQSSASAHRQPPPDLTVDQTIGLFLDSLVNRGANEGSVIVIAAYARRYFAAALSEPLLSLTPPRMRQLAEGVTQNSPRTGRMLARVTRHNVYQTARRFIRWCVAQGRLPADPMAAADPVALAELQAENVKLRRELGEAREQLRTVEGAR